MRQPVDLVVWGGHVVTMDAARAVHADGAVAIAGSRVVAVGPTAEVLGTCAPRRTIDARGRLVLPGFVESHGHPGAGLLWPLQGDPAQRRMHSHGGQILELIRGFTASLERRRLTLDECRVGALAYFASMVKAGTTCFNDGALATEPDGVAAAAIEAGVRLVVTRTSADMTVDGSGAHAALRRTADADVLLAAAEEMIGRWWGAAGGRIRAWPSLLWPLMCSDELCVGTQQLADRFDTGFHAHAAAALNEASASEQLFGKRTLERLHDLGVLGPAFLGVHMGFPDDREISQLADADAKVAHNPAQAGINGKDIVHAGAIPKMLAAGLTVGLGTDAGFGQYGSMVHQMHLAHVGHQDANRDSTLLPPRKVLEMATIDAAVCARWDDEIGSLEVGKRADLVLVDISDIRYPLVRDPEVVFVRAGHAGDVRTVIVNGRIVVEDGTLVTLDEEALKREYVSAFTGLRARLNAPR